MKNFVSFCFQKIELPAPEFIYFLPGEHILCSFSKVYLTEMKNQVPVEYTKKRTGYLYMKGV
jgi:hypothetical protein